MARLDARLEDRKAADGRHKGGHDGDEGNRGMAPRSFGRMPDGTEIAEVEIAAGNLSAKIITYGAVIRDLRWAGIDHPLVLGFDDLDSYLHHSPYFGAVAGRCANRTGGGRLPIDGKVFQLSLNERGRTHLHGGFNGFGKRAWRLAAHDGRSVTLKISAADGEEGYPGNVEAEVKYTIEAPGQLRNHRSPRRPTHGAGRSRRPGRRTPTGHRAPASRLPHGVHSVP